MMSASIVFLRLRVVSLLLFASASIARADLPLSVHALTGDPAADLTGGETYLIFTYASNAPAGNRVAFTTLLSGLSVTFANDTCVYTGDPSAPSLIAREGDSAPTSFGETFDFVSAPSINATGTILFRSTLAPSGTALFRKVPAGALTTLTRDGTPVDNSSTVLVGSQIFGNRFAIDGAGNGYCIAELSGSSVTSADRYALLRAATAGTSTVARTGITIPPDVPVQVPAIRFDFFECVNANANGDVVFTASLSNVPLSTDRGIWLAKGGALSTIAREGGAAPGLPGVAFALVGLAIGIGDEGSVAFGAILSGSGVTTNNDQALWLGPPGAVKLLVREGDPAPGLDPGVVFDELLFLSFGEHAPAISPMGRAAFLGRVRGPGITAANNDCLWVQDGNGGLRLVIREGTLVPSANAMNAGIGNNGADYPPFTLDPLDGFSRRDRVIFCAETNNGSFDGIYEAEVPGDTVVPRVRINGPKTRKVRRPAVRLTGSATDNVAVASVEWQPGRAAFRRPAGVGSWRLHSRLKFGANRFTVRATDIWGNRSANAVATVRRVRR